MVDHLRPAALPIRPAVPRIGIGVFSAVSNFKRRRMIRNLHRQDSDRFAPVGVCRVLKVPLPPNVADAIWEAAQVTNFLTTLGVGHRVFGPLNVALQWWALTYRQSWGMLHHNDNMMLMHQCVLGVTRSADALSVDALVRHRQIAPTNFDRSYGGVLTAMNLATVAVYFISGVAKVRSRHGWKWADGQVLRDQIAADAIRKEVFGSKPPTAAGTLYRSQVRFGALSVIALAVELGAPLSLVHRRAGQVFSVAAWGMHIGIRVVMGIKFTYNVTGVSYLPYWPVGRQLPIG
ncbi:hypothetical protein [Nesterenkonia marinintestina]|uniref:hypothetical protein n=1 Tax=Nesterenkonia marinintestina TaxID=2979865 RepID=UPI0021BFF0E2|nr:hypothetical protein [Nesterenkonia sp. GX14115]